MITFAIVATVLIIGFIFLVGEVRGLPANVLPAKIVQSYVNGEFDIIMKYWS